MTDSMATAPDTQTPAAKGPKRETRVVSEGFVKRYTSGPGQFVLAIGACLALVLAIFLVTPSEDDPPLPRTIDYTWDAKEFARKAPYQVYSPTGLPPTWAATASRLTGTTAKKAKKHVAWHLVLVAPSQRYAALEQSNETPDGPGNFVARMTNVPKSTPDQAAGRRTVDGVVWDQYYQRDKRQYSLVRRLPGNTIVLTGTADYDELAVLAAALTPEPKGSLERRGLVARPGLHRGGQPGARALQPLLADPREPLAPLPQRQGLLQREPAGLQPLHHLRELVAGLLVRERLLGHEARVVAGR